eukprot:scaffold188866_cov22-Tisochrysis_lutea.AAC.1
MNKSRFVKWHGETVQKGSASGPNQHAAAGESAANEQVLPFEGEGYTEVGTIRRDEDFDDEFDYAFEGQNREGAVHQQVGLTVQQSACLQLGERPCQSKASHCYIHNLRHLTP